MPAYDGNDGERKLVVVKLPDVLIALDVDGVSEIHDFSEKDIVPMPGLVLNEDTKFFRRVAHVNGRLIILMDVNHLLSEEELENVKKMKEDMK